MFNLKKTRYFIYSFLALALAAVSTVSFAVDSQVKFFKASKDKAALVSKISFKQANKKYIDSSEIKKITSLVKLIKSQYPTNLIVLAGFTDSKGSKKLNKKLSYQRAKSIKNILVSLELKSSNIFIEAFGARNFLAANSTWKGRAENRRVEFVVLNKGQVFQSSTKLDDLIKTSVAQKINYQDVIDSNIAYNLALLNQKNQKIKAKVAPQAKTANGIKSAKNTRKTKNNFKTKLEKKVSFDGKKFKELKSFINKNNLKKEFVYFKSGRSALTELEKTKIKKVIKNLRKKSRYISVLLNMKAGAKKINLKNKKILVLGFSDPKGNSVSNLKLSIKRSEAAKRYLISQGIPPNKIATANFGESFPKVNGNFNKANEVNRRVEIYLIDTEVKIFNQNLNENLARLVAVADQPIFKVIELRKSVNKRNLAVNLNVNRGNRGSNLSIENIISNLEIGANVKKVTSKQDFDMRVQEFIAANKVKDSKIKISEENGIVVFNNTSGNNANENLQNKEDMKFVKVKGAFSPIESLTSLSDNQEFLKDGFF